MKFKVICQKCDKEYDLKEVLELCPSGVAWLECDCGNEWDSDKWNE